jgi:hypothetical protein
MSSLRLAEAFLRAAAPEGHEPLSDLPALRRHMTEVHGFAAADLIPRGVLLRMHDQDHYSGHGDPHERTGEDAWQHSGDAAHSPGFIAGRQRVVTGMLHYDPHVREVLPLHMMSHHGWSAGEVREAMEWPEAANALPGHHDAEHSIPMHEHVAVPHAHEDVSHQWPPPQPDETDLWDEFGRD